MDEAMKRDAKALEECLTRVAKAAGHPSIDLRFDKNDVMDIYRAMLLFRDEAPKIDIQTVADAADEKVVKDLRGRKGLKHEWSGIDAEIVDEIEAAWSKIIFDTILEAEKEHG